MSGRGIRLLGLDPGLRRTGWGVIDVIGNRLSHVANGTVTSTASLSTPERLAEIYTGVAAVIARYAPDEAAAEETFVNKNPDSTLKLGLARGAVLVAPAVVGLRVAEYAPNRVKKSVVGAGHADKHQVQIMVAKLLPGIVMESEDSADALAVAICHAHFAQPHAVSDAGKQTMSKQQTAKPAGGGMQGAIDAALARDARPRTRQGVRQG